MNITEFGRVELDITKVPTSTLVSKQAPERFEDRLGDAARSHPTERQETRRVDARNPEAPETAEPPAGEDGGEGGDARDIAPGARENRDPRTRDDAAAVGDPAPPRDTTSQDSMHPAYGAHPAHPAHSAHPAHPAHPEEGPVGGAGAGRGRGPSASLSRGQPNQVPGDGSAPGVAPGGGARTQPPSGPVQGQAQGEEVRAIAEAERGAGHAARRSMAPAGHRTPSTARLAAAEAARDSVIKQIAFQLGPDGGRMRLHLDPPELGRLDIHMVVEKGAVLQLSMAVERPEVLAMLNRYVPELRQALTQQGLDLSGADVETSLFEQDQHDGGSRGRHGGSAAAMNHDELDTPLALRRMGYVTAEGLDFWV